MVRNFIYLQSHKKCVINLYRHTLRNALHCCHSVYLAQKIKKITRQTILRHRSDKSSWSVHFLLSKLQELNVLLVQRDVKLVWDLLTKVATKKNVLKSSKILTALRKVDRARKSAGLQSPKTVRDAGILNAYIRKEQAHDRLPHFVPEEYKIKLLLPMALHERAIIKLNTIQRRLSHGPPRVVLSHTATMGSRIWFVRSALNKKKRQSKALGRLIRREKIESRQRWDSLNSCTVAAGWAVQEANWEHLIQKGTIVKFDLDKYLKSSNIEGQDNKIIEEWLAPVRESLTMLKHINRTKTEYFRDYKNNVLLKGGQAQYYADRSRTVYEQRVRRFKEMAKYDLPYAVPFIPNHDLSSIMAKYRL